VQAPSLSTRAGPDCARRQRERTRSIPYKCEGTTHHFVVINLKTAKALGLEAVAPICSSFAGVGKSANRERTFSRHVINAEALADNRFLLNPEKSCRYGPQPTPRETNFTRLPTWRCVHGWQRDRPFADEDLFEHK